MIRPFFLFYYWSIPGRFQRLGLFSKALDNSVCKLFSANRSVRLANVCGMDPFFDCFEPSVMYTGRSEEHTSELQSRGHLVCRLLLEKKKKKHTRINLTN